MFYLVSKINLEKIIVDGIEFGERIVDKSLTSNGCFPVNSTTHEWREATEDIGDIYNSLWYWCPSGNDPKLAPAPEPQPEQGNI